MKITITDQDKVIASTPGRNLGQLLVENNLLPGLPCGHGKCGKCAVKILSGAVELSPKAANAANSLPDGWILSCCAITGADDLQLQLVNSGQICTDKGTSALQTELIPPASPIRKIFAQLAKPTSQNPAPHLENLLSALGGNFKLPLPLLQNLPALLEDADYAVTAVVHDDNIIALEKGDTTARQFGFAVDLGTTSIAVYLLDLQNGKICGSKGIANGQAAFGSDVVSRIEAAADQKTLRRLQCQAITGINQACEQLLTAANIMPDQVYSMLIVANPAMSHLLLGINPASLAKAPFTLAHKKRLEFAAREFNLAMHPDGIVNVLGNISAFVGSDALAVAVACNMERQSGWTLAVDIGTNGEVLLAGEKEIFACAAAAGPAFEAASITCGMTAGPGAIAKVKLTEAKPEFEVIGDMGPKGICGSGLIDLTAELLRLGLIDASGRLAKPGELAMPIADRLRVNKNGMTEFCLVQARDTDSGQDIVLTQKDIRELQQAKAAISAGIETLCKVAGIGAKQIGQVFLAGAFGNHLDIGHTAALGLFGNIPLSRIRPCGNAAGTGAMHCLLSRDRMSEADTLQSRIIGIDLAGREDFNQLWLNNLNFPETRHEEE